MNTKALRPLLLAITVFCSQPLAAQGIAEFRSLMTSAREVSVEARQASSAIDQLSRRLSRSKAPVVPPIWDRIGKNLSELQASVKDLADAALSTGEPSLIAEAQMIVELQRSLPKGNEISEVILRLSQGGTVPISSDNDAERQAPGAGQVTEIVQREAALKYLASIQNTLDHLIEAAPCIRREIQELDE